MRIWRLAGPILFALGCSERSGSEAQQDAPWVAPHLPERLSDTGLYKPGTRTLAEGVVAYAPKWPLYSDAASKERYLLLPLSGQSDIDTSNMDGWQFPVGTKAWKFFAHGSRHLETRLLYKVSATQWVGVSYLWDAAGSDAMAVLDGAQDVLGTSHDVPSQSACSSCHAGAVDQLLGVSAAQLDLGNGGGFGLLDLVAAGRLTSPPDAANGDGFYFPWSGSEQQVRALGYLHANCGSCHNDVAPTGSAVSMRLWLRIADGLALEQSAPVATTVGVTAASQQCDGVPVSCATLRVAVGEPEMSVLYRRFVSTNPARHMPPLGTETTDEDGRLLLAAWIESLAP